MKYLRLKNSFPHYFIELNTINYKLIMPFTEFLPKPYGIYDQDNIREFYY